MAFPWMRFVLALALMTVSLGAQGGKGLGEPGPAAALSLILGRPSDRSATLSVLSETECEAYVGWGRKPEALTGKSQPVSLKRGIPAEIRIDDLPPNSQSFYRLFTRRPSQPGFEPGPTGSIQTQRAPGATFTFALQGDSHPERRGKMFDPSLYTRTLRNVAQNPPDFYLTLGDDFSIDRLINRQELSQPNVDQVYAHQRGFLGLVGASSALFLVNGNHEQAARYLLDGTDTNAAVLAGRARARFFPLPAPDAFYSGDTEPVEPIGLLRDYYAWTWGDALFVVIDPYWHSPVPVDNRAGEGPGEKGKKGGKGNRDLWQLTLGEGQYRWLEKTLLQSKARWKFVFAHHVNGTGRGGIEEARLYEWGGQDRRGVEQFKEKRPGWPLPIHPLMVKAGVTIFFQGHDHLYARQELDGVIYQSTPNPADPTYTAFNREAYGSGDILPNSGHLRVTVAPEQVKVDYIRTFLPSDEGEGQANGIVAHGYSVRRK